MGQETPQPDVITRIEKYLADHEEAPKWGGPTIYPKPPSLDDLRALLALIKVATAIPAVPGWEHPGPTSSAGFFISEARKMGNAIFVELKVAQPDERMEWAIRGTLQAIADQIPEDDLEVACDGLISTIRNALSHRRLHFQDVRDRTTADFWRQLEDVTARGLLKLPAGSSFGFALPGQTIEVKDKEPK